MKKFPYISKWLKMSRDSVLDKFMNLKGAYTDGLGQERFVYVEGDRDDRVLLVAHADTVWGSETFDLGYYCGILYSKSRTKNFKQKNKWRGETHRCGVGIGADDRAGCGILWLLRDLGHSLLITSGEESGCIAAKRLANNKWWREKLNNHNFAVEFDRRGYKDCVFYDVGTNKFAKYIQEETGYKSQSGFGTDIKVICSSICGVNLSVGYYSEHSPDEKLVVDQWKNTLTMSREWLSKPTPKFELSYQDKFEIPTKNYGYSYEDDYYRGYSYNKHQTTNPIIKRGKFLTTPVGLIAVEEQPVGTAIVRQPYGEKTISCPYCKTQITQKAWFENYFKCYNCKKII